LKTAVAMAMSIVAIPVAPPLVHSHCCVHSGHVHSGHTRGAASGTLALLAVVSIHKLLIETVVNALLNGKKTKCSDSGPVY